MRCKICDVGLPDGTDQCFYCGNPMEGYDYQNKTAQALFRIAKDVHTVRNVALTFLIFGILGFVAGLLLWLAETHR